MPLFGTHTDTTGETSKIKNLSSEINIRKNAHRMATYGITYDTTLLKKRKEKNIAKVIKMFSFALGVGQDLKPNVSHSMIIHYERKLTKVSQTH